MARLIPFSTRRRGSLLSLAVACVVASTACSGSSGSTTTSEAPASTTTSTTLAPVALTRDQLTAALLQPADAGTDFTSNPALLSSADSDPIGCAALDQLQRTVKSAGQEAQVALVNGTNTRLVSEDVASLPTEAAAAFAQFQANVNQCTTFAITAGGQRVSFTLTPLTLGRKGDESYAGRFVAGSTATTANIDFVVARVGSTLVAVLVTTTGPPDNGYINAIADRAVQKVASM